jgi:hypothetical protein
VIEEFLRQRILESFRYPVPPAPRTAVLVPWFRPALLASQPVRIFPRGWGNEAARYEPLAVAATREQCRALCGYLIPSLTHALIVLERPAEPRLTEADRNALWRAFRVPVFEQIIGPAGELLAGECEAHEGLHIEAPGLRLPQNMIDSTPCACGRKSPRFGFERGPELERRVAAYAR